MKKTLAIFMVAVMLVVSIPFVASAAQITSDITSNFVAMDGDEVPAGTTIQVSAALTIPENTTFVNRGTIQIISGGGIFCEGTFENYGTVTGGNVVTTGDGKVMNAVTIPGRVPNLYNVFKYTWNEILEEYQKTAVMSSTTFLVEKGSDFSFEVQMQQLQHDNATFPVWANGIAVPYERGYFTLFDVTQPVDVTFGAPQIKQFVIDLPYAEGYMVVEYGQADVPDDDVIHQVTKTFGQNLSFTVRLNPEFSNSEGSFRVFVNGNKLEPDEYGYYDVISLGSDGTLAYEITVVGVVQNSMTDMLARIIDLFQSIFEMIQGFFAEFGNLFGGGDGETVTP